MGECTSGIAFRGIISYKITEFTVSLEHNKIPGVLVRHQNQSSAELVGWLALYIRYKSVYIQSIIIQMMRRLKMTLVAHHPGRCTICIRASGLTALTL
jgi:hypothetical protein